MASRTGINIYIPKYFMAVRNCINIFVLYGLDVLHRHISIYVRLTLSMYVFFINDISVDLFVYRRST